MKKRALFALLLIAMLSITAVGSMPTQAQDVVELRMLWYSDGVEGDVMRNLLDRFQEEHPNIIVIMDTVAPADLQNTLQAQIETGDAPDIARIIQASSFAGQYLDLRPYLQDPAYFETNFPAPILNSMRSGLDDTGIYGYPTQLTVTGPYINRTLFELAGVPVPSDTSDSVTWQEWVDAAVTVAEATDTPYAVAIDRSGHRFWGPSLSNCATYLNPDNTFTIDTPGFRTTAEMLKDWYDRAITPLDVWAGAGGQYASASQYFANGQLVFYMSGSWQISQFASQIGDLFTWEAVPNPSGECGSTGIPSSSVLVGFNSTDYPQEVATLMEWLASQDVLAEFSANSQFIPGHLGLVEQGVEYSSNSAALNVFLTEVAKLTPDAYALQYHPNTADLDAEMRDRLGQYVIGEMTLDDAITAIQAKMDEVVVPISDEVEPIATEEAEPAATEEAAPAATEEPAPTATEAAE
jgi:alpha-1,4-digalacturonate transport system substrate-binding protein